ncbi:hypothetical protein [Pelomonas aquatica]|nr:hypothetical protein [Pelomonas aquatica]
MKVGDPISTVALAQVDECTFAGPAATAAAPNPKKTISASTFTTHPALVSSMLVEYTALVAAIVRTCAAGTVVSVKSTAATGRLAEGVLEYLDSSALGLTVDPEFGDLKDFVSTAYTGILGAALSYLRMLRDGYSWKAHYEEIASPTGSATAEPEPDFVFAKLGDLAVVESKGTGADLPKALAAAKNGYLKQIVSVAARPLNGSIFPSRGYAFGTALNAASSGAAHVQMACVFGEFLPGAGAASGVAGPPVAPGAQRSLGGLQLVRKANYAELYRQLGLNANNVGTVLSSAPSDITLHQSPNRIPLVVDGEPWTATIALPVGIIRSIERGYYPEALPDAAQNRGPTVVPGTKERNLIFVNFPDHSRVLLRKETPRASYVVRSVELE